MICLKINLAMIKILEKIQMVGLPFFIYGINIEINYHLKRK